MTKKKPDDPYSNSMTLDGAFSINQYGQIEASSMTLHNCRDDDGDWAIGIELLDDKGKSFAVGHLGLDGAESFASEIVRRIYEERRKSGLMPTRN